MGLPSKTGQFCHGQARVAQFEASVEEIFCFASFFLEVAEEVVPKFHHTLSFMVESRAVASLCLNTAMISRIVRRKDKDNLDLTIVSTSLNISSSEVL